MSDSKYFVSFRKRMKDFLVREFGSENVCPFWGNQNAKIVHISQAPSFSVVKNQKPFTDKSGERLRRDWYQVSEEVFYDPSNFYFTAVGMYFPGKDKKGGDKRPNCKLAKQWLTKELSYLKPELYLILGGLAAKFFFPDKKLNDLVFSNQEIKGKPALILPHPSPINIKWFKDNPRFEKDRVFIVKENIHRVLSIK